MKKMIVAFALLACVACKNTSSTEVSDPNSANMPKAECGGCPGKSAEGCSEAAKSECSGKKAECTAKPQG